MVVVKINRKRFSITLLLLMFLLVGCFGYTPIMKNVVYPCKYKDIVESAARKNNVDPMLIYSIMKAESKFDERAVSRTGAKGLMQIMDETAKWAYKQMEMDEKSDIYVPAVNINVGTWYIGKLLRDNGGNTVAALASYNAGGSNVNKWKDAAGTDNIKKEDIQFDETGKYVEKIMKYYEQYKKLY
mgnify:CR=1 FL=1